MTAAWNKLLLTTAVAALWLAAPIALAEGGGDGVSVTLPPPPTVSEPQPGKAPDRAKSSAAAKAAALGGAAMSKVMCMMMMAEAMKEKDTSKKAMMMMAAQMACQQAAQMEQSAAENDKGHKLASQDDIPKQSKFEAKGMALPSGTGKDQNVLKNYSVTNVEDGLKTGDLPTSTLTMPDLSVFDEVRTAAEPAPVPAESELLKGVVASPLDAKSPLTPIEPSKLNYDDKAKQANAANSALGGGGFGGIGGGAASPAKTDDAGKRVASGGGGEGDDAPSRRRGKDSSGGEAEGGGGGGGGSEKSGGSDPFEAMLASLLGPPPAEGGGSRGTDEVSVLPTRNDPAKAQPNIFEYAAFRFQKLAFEQGRIRSGLHRKAQLLPRTAEAPGTAPAAAAPTMAPQGPALTSPQAPRMSKLAGSPIR